MQSLQLFQTRSEVTPLDSQVPLSFFASPILFSTVSQRDIRYKGDMEAARWLIEFDSLLHELNLLFLQRVQTRSLSDVESVIA